MFTPCPVRYCCASSGECSSYDTCEGNREGVLCGKCKKGFSLNLMSTSCVDDSHCSEGIEVTYTGVQCITALAYVLFLMWLKEIVLLVKRKVQTLIGINCDKFCEDFDCEKFAAKCDFSNSPEIISSRNVKFAIFITI